MGEFVKVCEVTDVPPGTMHAIDVPGIHMMVVNVEGQLYAVDRICTHETADLSTGFLIGTEVTCPLHLSRFDVRTGTVQNPPAATPLRTHELKVKGASVYVLV